MKSQLMHKTACSGTKAEQEEEGTALPALRPRIGAISFQERPLTPIYTNQYIMYSRGTGQLVLEPRQDSLPA